jgi:hypothetical protein
VAQRRQSQFKHYFRDLRGTPGDFHTVSRVNYLPSFMRFDYKKHAPVFEE